jgi:UDP-N-acetylglucosamine enolpyruvyl transferase
MPSQVGGDLANIQTGPSKVTYKGEACGHTVGGVRFSVTPDLRERRVDEYGTYLVDMIHQGDRVEVRTTFAEKSMQVIQTVYAFGYSVDANTWGIGVTPGQKASDKSGLLLLHPLNGEGTTDDVKFFEAIVSTTGEVNFGTVTDDRVFEATFMPMIDESKNSGQLIGTIGTSIELPE